MVKLEEGNDRLNACSHCCHISISSSDGIVNSRYKLNESDCFKLISFTVCKKSDKVKTPVPAGTKGESEKKR